MAKVRLKVYTNVVMDKLESFPIWVTTDGKFQTSFHGTLYETDTLATVEALIRDLIRNWGTTAWEELFYCARTKRAAQAPKPIGVIRRSSSTFPREKAGGALCPLYLEATYNYAAGTIEASTGLPTFKPLACEIEEYTLIPFSSAHTAYRAFLQEARARQSEEVRARAHSQALHTKLTDLLSAATDEDRDVNQILWAALA